MLLGFAGVFAAGFAIVMGFGLEEASGVVTIVGVVALLVIVLMGVLRKNARGSTPGGDTNSDAHLEWILFGNTIRFNDLQFLQFPKRGSYFMIGKNGSGKSSVFELVRRCLGSTKNNSFSSIFDRKKMSYAICAYEVGDDKYIISATFGIPSRAGEKGDYHINVACELKYEVKKPEETSSNAGEKGDQHALEPAIYSKETQSNAEKRGDPTAPEYVYKMKKSGVDIVTQRKKGLHSQKLKCSSDLIEEYFERIALKMNGKVDGEDIQSIVADLQKCVEEMSNDKVSHGTNKVSCNDILETLDTKVVHIFSAGAIGTLQWSESKRMFPGYRDDNYQSACNNAEILTWYLQLKDKLREKEIDRVEDYFQILTDGSKIRFCLERSNFYSYNKIIVKDGNRQVPLLKLSEGILEAMKFSIILGVDRFKTILYEDPERGMHPQMIQRMRDMILRNITKKTILITSHHPAFTAFWNLDRVYVFRPARKTPKSFIVKKVPNNDASARLHLSTWEYSTIFFAGRIIFVEGPSDVLVVSELKDLLIKTMTQRDDGTYSIERDGLGTVLGAADTNLKRFTSFLIGLEVISAECKYNLPTFKKICTSLLIDCLTLKDNDDLKRKKVEDRTRVEEMNMAKHLGNEFKWGNGELEDVLIDFAEVHDTVCLQCETKEVKMHAKMATSVNELVGYSKKNHGNQKYKKIDPSARRTDVETFLDAAIYMLVNEETYRNCVRGRQILDFIKFLFRHAEKANE